MRATLVFLAAATALGGLGCDAQVFYNENDLRRLQNFGDCERKFPSLKKMATTPGTQVFGQANMDSCNKQCMAENLSDHERYMNCYSCCDSYFGQTERKGAGEAMIPPMQAGRFPFGTGWSGTYCRDIKFKKAYPKSLNVNHIHLQVVATHDWETKPKGDGTIPSHHGVFTWVEWIRHTGFRACVAETGHHDNKHDSKMAIDWMSWSNDEGYRGVTGTFKTGVSRGDVCKQVAFGLAGEVQKTVSLVTTNHRNWGSTHHPIMTWVKETTASSFTPCARETTRNDDWHDRVEFDYATFAKGAVCPGEYVIDSTRGKRHVRWYNGSGNTKTIRCQVIPFPVAFPTVPIVMATGHVPRSLGAAIWVETVAKDRFVACLQSRKGEALIDIRSAYIDYVARTENANVKGCREGSCPISNGHYCSGQGLCAGKKCYCLAGRSGNACEN